MGKFLRTFFLLSLFALSFQLKAGHMAGGIIQYKCVGLDSFEVTATIYRDCKGVNLNPIVLNVVGVGCNYSTKYTLTNTSCADVTPRCKTSCSRCDGSSCNAYGYPNGSNASCALQYGIEKIVFKETITFQNTNCCKFRLEVLQSTRNGALSTCCAADSFYNYAELDRCVSPQNSSPIISNEPLYMLNVGNCTTINVGALDTVDHDSLSYHLVPVLKAFGTQCNYQWQYTYKKPLYYDSFSSVKKFDPKKCTGIILDSLSGDLKFKPMQQQVSQIVIEIREWRKDSNCVPKMVGLARVDFQIIIEAKFKNNIPTLPSASPLCGFGGDKLCFSNIQSTDPDTTDSVYLSWNHAIPNATFTTFFPNKSKKQQFNFCWQTTASDTSNIPYYFTVIANDGVCPREGRALQTYSVSVAKKPDIARQITYLGCGKIKLGAIPLNQNLCSDIYSYSWKVDGAKYNIQNTTATIKQGGKIYISLTVGINGCSVYYYDSITVPPFLNIDIGPDTSTCFGTAITFKSIVSSGIPPYSYQWLQGSAKDTLDSFVFVGTTASYIICKVTDSMGCINYDTLYLTIMQLPKLSIADQRKCDGDKIFFDAGNNNLNVKYFLWQDTLTGKTLSNLQQYNTTFQQTLKVSLTDWNNCVAYDTVTAFFNPPIKLFAGSDKIQCGNDTLQYTTTGVDYAVWNKLGDTNILYTGINYSTSVNSNTTLLLKGFKAISNLTCVGYDTIQIQYAIKPFVKLLPQYVICIYDSVKMETLLNANYKYKWNTGDSNNYIYPKQAGNYAVVVSNNFGCSDSASTQFMYFPIQTISLSISNDTLFANNSNFTKYNWYYNNAFDTTTIVPWLYITQIADYTVTGTDKNGCDITSKSLSVKTLKSGTYTVPNAYGIKVYPNPSTGIYYIESPITISDLMIYDLTGRKIYNNSSNNNSIFDLSGQAEGVYLLQINKLIWFKLSKL